MFCKKCGKTINDNSEVCEFCGEKIAFSLKNDIFIKVKEKLLSNKRITIIGSICLVSILILVIIFSNISKGISKNDIKKYYLENHSLGENENIKSIEIISKEEMSNGDLKISAIIVTEDEEYRYIKEGGVVCYKTSNGWEIRNAFTEYHSDYDIEPLKGITEKGIKETLDGASVTIDDEIWDIDDNNISSIKIEKQDTSLKEKKDFLSVSVVLEDSVQEAKGKFDLEYTFDKKWNLDKCTENGKFTSTTKPGKELNITEDILASNLYQQKIKFGIENSTQDFTIYKNELSNLKINEQVVSDKGKSIEYKCSGTITKKFATFILDVSIVYYYSGRWEFQNFSATAKCESTNISGTLKGTNVYGWPCRLILSGVDAKGDINGSYYYDGNSANKGHSFNVSGNLDLETFTLKLKPGTIISKPFSFYKANILQGYIDIDNGTLIFYDDIQKITLGLN